MMSRYKPVGWRYESRKHSLAAKGIATKHNYSAHKVYPNLYVSESVPEIPTTGATIDERVKLAEAKLAAAEADYADTQAKFDRVKLEHPVASIRSAIQAREEELADQEELARLQKQYDDLVIQRNKPIGFYAKKSNIIEYKDAPKGAEYDKVGIDSKGRRVRLYSKEHKESVAKKKFSRVDRLKKKYPQILSCVEKDLSSKDQSTRENAMAMYVILKTGLRPGSYKETLGDVQAYGVSTLKAEHVSVKGNVVRFHFIGKKGVKIEKVVVDPKMASIIRKQKKSGKELFPTVNDSSLRSYVAKFGQYKTKDFRTLHANTIATKLMNKGVDRKAVVVQVAAELQNTPGVAKSAYIAPSTYDSLKSKIVKDVESAAKRTKRDDLQAASEEYKHDKNVIRGGDDADMAQLGKFTPELTKKQIRDEKLIIKMANSV